MRVVHLTRDYPPPVAGGMSTAVRGLVEASAGRLDAPVHVVSFERGGDGRVESVGAARVLRARAGGDAVRRFVAEAAPDVVHLHDARFLDAARGHDARLVYTPHVVQAALATARGIAGANAGPNAGGAAQQRAIEAADVVVAPSGAAARMLDLPWVLVAPLGVDPPPPPSAPGDEETLLFVGRWQELKGIFAAIDLAAPILRERPGAILHLVGGMPARAKSDRRARRLVQRHVPEEVRERVRLAGWLTGDDLEAAFAGATVLIHPSAVETVGLSVLEAMARGLPVVTTRCGGPEERIADEVTGRLVPVGNLEAARRAVTELLDDPAKRRSMGAAARAAAAEWTWASVVDRWLAAYEPAAARRTRVRRRWTPPPGPEPARRGVPGPDETLDHLGGEWRIFQRRRGHRWSTDDLAVAWYACRDAPPEARLLDLGAGVGSIALLCAWRLPAATVVGVEAQAASAALFRRSVVWNGAGARVDVRLGDLRDPDPVPPDTFDVVTANPPYVDPGLGAASPDAQREHARIARRGNAPEYIAAAARALKPGGRLVMVHHDAAGERLHAVAAEHGLQPERRRTVVFREGRAAVRPVVALYAWRLGAATYVEEPPLVVRREGGERSPEWSAARVFMGLPP